MKWVMKWTLPLVVAALTGCVGNVSKSSTPTAEVPKTDTQVYTGHLPCRYCSRIETRLVLNGLIDSHAEAHRFSMEAKYINHEGRIGGRRYAGTWDRVQATPTDPSTDVFSLTDQRMGVPVIFHFQQIDARTLEILDGHSQRYENGRGLRLYLESGHQDTAAPTGTSY